MEKDLNLKKKNLSQGSADEFVCNSAPGSWWQPVKTEWFSFIELQNAAQENLHNILVCEATVRSGHSLTAIYL